MAKKRQSFSTRKVIRSSFTAQDKQALRRLSKELKDPKKQEPESSETKE